ncbi:hypothetical protein [Candidatus Odyssella thessalonicensis]|uniref:hypothetical protein n=1 Tax=Candidatus Odyssella thessalonicensis TaxID=84647 RepID=UPI000225ABE8|nr:hypothetical protein [Candidatus Odyssella thessalonicensis]
MKNNSFKIIKCVGILSLFLGSTPIYAMELEEEEKEEKNNWSILSAINTEATPMLPFLHEPYKRVADNSDDLIDSLEIDPLKTEVKKVKGEEEAPLSPAMMPISEISNIIGSLRAEEMAQQYILQKNHAAALRALVEAERLADEPFRKSVLNEKIGDLYLQLNDEEDSLHKALEFYLHAQADNANPMKKSSLYEKMGDVISRLTVSKTVMGDAAGYYLLAQANLNEIIEMSRSSERKSELFEKKASLLKKQAELSTDNHPQYSKISASEAYWKAASLTTNKQRKCKLLVLSAEIDSHLQNPSYLVDAASKFYQAAELLAEQGEYAEAAKMSRHGIGLEKRYCDTQESSASDLWVLPGEFQEFIGEQMLKTSHYYYKGTDLNGCYDMLNLSYSAYEEERESIHLQARMAFLYNFAYVAVKIDPSLIRERAMGAVNELKTLAENYEFEKDTIGTLRGRVHVSKLKQGESLLNELKTQ